MLSSVALHRFGTGVHRIHRRVTGSVGCDSCVLPGDPRRLPRFPQALPLLTNSLDRFTMLIADLARFLRQLPEPFRLTPGRLGCNTVFFGGLTPCSAS